jgi:hypothetical protein
MIAIVSQGGSSMAENIRSTEYQQFLDLKEQVQKGMEGAETEFMFQTYKKLLTVLNKRHEAAMKLNIILENSAVRELARQKLESFKTPKVS